VRQSTSLQGGRRRWAPLASRKERRASANHQRKKREPPPCKGRRFHHRELLGEKGARNLPERRGRGVLYTIKYSVERGSLAPLSTPKKKFHLLTRVREMRERGLNSSRPDGGRVQGRYFPCRMKGKEPTCLGEDRRRGSSLL